VRPTTETDALAALLDETTDGLLLIDAGGEILLANRPFRQWADRMGASLGGAFPDRLLELADRTTEPYAFAAAVEALRVGAGRIEFEDAAATGVYQLHVSDLEDAGRAWVLRDVTRERGEERARDDRVAALGHELRTPLTAMAGFIELLEEGGAGPLTAEQARYLEIVRRAAERLQGLIGELLDERKETA